MVVMVGGRLVEVSDLQNKKASLQMVITVSSILIYLRDALFIKTLSLINVTILSTSAVVTSRQQIPIDP